MVKHLGWRTGALATPLMMGLLGIPFFGSIFFNGHHKNNVTHTKTSLYVAVLFGALQSILSKATKYALFDPTYQMAYIPLDEESKVKGKAAIDILGSRLGKSVGSFLLQACVVYFGSALQASPVVAGIFYSVILSWIVSANKLADMFEERTSRIFPEKQKMNIRSSPRRKDDILSSKATEKV